MVRVLFGSLIGLFPEQLGIVGHLLLLLDQFVECLVQVLAFGVNSLGQFIQCGLSFVQGRFDLFAISVFVRELFRRLFGRSDCGLLLGLSGGSVQLGELFGDAAFRRSLFCQFRRVFVFQRIPTGIIQLLLLFLQLGHVFFR